MQLDFFNSEDVLADPDTETRVCKVCGEEKSLSEFSTHFTSAQTGATYWQRRCKPCQSKRVTQTYHIKKTAAPLTSNCECCGVSFEGMAKNNIHMDHCEETQTFRGWLCRGCNVGIGYLGDDIESLQKAMDYLQRHNGRLPKKAD